MTTKDNEFLETEDQWLSTYVAQERSRTLTLGVAVLMAIFFFTLAVIYYFANMAVITG